MYYRLITTVILAFTATAAHALWIGPDGRVPVSRLIANIEQQLVETPDDPNLLARLARVHSMAYALGDVDLPVMGKGENPQYTYYEQGNGYPSTRRALDGPTILARFSHLHQAVTYYQQAARLGPNEHYIWLGLGYAYDEMAHAATWLANPVNEPGAPKEAADAVRHAWEQKALEAYAHAMGESPKLDGGLVTPPVELEAARYIRLILEPRNKRTREEQQLLKTAVALAQEAARRPRAVTPIIFPLDAPRPLQHLLAKDLSVKFDLDGTEQGSTWPWVQPDTALLVWDGNGQGAITSGRQLIGSVTWWLFWENGYAVLRTLDDNRDGWLSGSELTGLAAWRDANSNGVSDPGEVIPLATLGVRRLSVQSTGTVDGMPVNPVGLEMNDGRILPTYDWITEPIPD